MVLGCFYPLCCFFLVFCVFLIIFVGLLKIAAINRGYMRAYWQSSLINLSSRVRLEIVACFCVFYSSGRKSQQYKVPGLKFILKAFPKFPFEVYFCGAFVKKWSNKPFKFLFLMSDNKYLSILCCDKLLPHIVIYYSIWIYCSECSMHQFTCAAFSSVAPQSHQWYSWGPPNMQCRLCASCWIYWKKYGGLKMPTQTDEDKLSSSQPTEVGLHRQTFLKQNIMLSQDLII